MPLLGASGVNERFDFRGCPLHWEPTTNQLQVAFNKLLSQFALTRRGKVATMVATLGYRAVCDFLEANLALPQIGLRWKALQAISDDSVTWPDNGLTWV